MQLDQKFAKPSFSPELEGPRAFLAIGVLVHHCFISRNFYITGRWELTESYFVNVLGNAAVTLFFFLTGYLFWRRVLKRGRITHRLEFLKARLLRIVPAYAASILVIFVIAFAETSFVAHESLTTFLGELLQWLSLGVAGFPFINQLSDSILINAGVLWTIRFELVFTCWFRCSPISQAFAFR